MKICKHAFLIGLVMLLLQTVSSMSDERLGVSIVTDTNNTALLPTAGEVEKYLIDRSEPSTQRLIWTLESIESQKLYYIDNFCHPTEDQKMEGPPMYDSFVKIVHELASRGGKQVCLAFEEVLTQQKLDFREKSLVRESLRRDLNEDAPFTLPATDRAQSRQYLLRFNPKEDTKVVVNKGGVLLKIARKAYPQLSQWSAVDIVSFINDIQKTDSVHPNQILNIYKYEIVQDSPAPWTITGSQTNK
jgi:hypothetical protein